MNTETNETNEMELKIGNLIYIPGTQQSSRLVGKITKVHQVNLVVEVNVQFAPNGKIYNQNHKVRIETLPEGTRTYTPECNNCQDIKQVQISDNEWGICQECE